MDYSCNTHNDLTKKVLKRPQSIEPQLNPQWGARNQLTSIASENTSSSPPQAAGGPAGRLQKTVTKLVVEAYIIYIKNHCFLLLLNYIGPPLPVIG